MAAPIENDIASAYGSVMVLAIMRDISFVRGPWDVPGRVGCVRP